MQAVLRAKEGAPSLPPGRYFRKHMIGYLEGLDSERGIVWRCSDSRSLGDFLRLGRRDKVPDHSRLSKTHSHLPHEVHEKVFAFVLNLVAERGLVKANALTSMVRRWRPTPHCGRSCVATMARYPSAVGRLFKIRRSAMLRS